MTKTFFARPALTIAAMLIAGSTVPAFAHENAGTVSTQRAVALTGVDVSSDAGVARLYDQVRRAALRACEPDGQTTGELQHAKACTKAAIADGNAKVDALHQQALASRSTAQTLASIEKR
jgi:UrcA family protein